MKVVILAAGTSSEYKQAGYQYPKNLVEVDSQLMIHNVMSSALGINQDVQLIVLITEEEDQRFYTSEIVRMKHPAATIVRVEGETAGALCTALLAIDLIDDNEEVIIMNADQLIKADLSEIHKKFLENRFDAGTISFKTSHPRFSFVRLDDNNRILEASEKRPISTDATAGFYWFSSGKIFKDAAKSQIRNRQEFNGKYYVCPVFNELVLRGLNCGAVEITNENYASFQSPQLLEKYLHEQRK